METPPCYRGIVEKPQNSPEAIIVSNRSVAKADPEINLNLRQVEGPGAFSDRPSREAKAGGPLPPINPTGEILSDPTSRGKERPWVAKHLGSRKVAAAYSALGNPKKSARCRDCGTVLTFNECPVDGQKRLVKANFCRERLCRMCSWRLSLKWSATVSRVLHQAASEHPEWQYVMLTLTQRNVPSAQLGAELSRMLVAWHKLTQRQEFRAVAGSFRSLEVTRNSKLGPWQGTWHPHIHALLAVEPVYFGRGYVTQKRWREVWAEVMGLDYDPSIDVHKVKTRQNGESLEAAAREVGKYAVKDDDVLGRSADEGDPDGVDPDLIGRVAVLDAALRGRHLVAWGGELKAIAKRIAPTLPEGEEDLVRITDEDHGPNCPVCGLEMLRHTYRWVQAVRQYVG